MRLAFTSRMAFRATLTWRRASRGDGRVAATVRATSFLGGFRRHQVEAGGLSLVVDQTLGTGEAIRPRMWLVIDPTGLHILPERIS